MHIVTVYHPRNSLVPFNENRSYKIDFNKLEKHNLHVDVHTNYKTNFIKIYAVV